MQYYVYCVFYLKLIKVYKMYVTCVTDGQYIKTEFLLLLAIEALKSV